jgi:Tol biopolymer transport system component
LPQWSSDGRFLVVEQPRGAPPKVSTINVLPVDGGRQRLLTTGSEPAISFRGSRVAFVRHTYRRAGDKFVVATSSLYTIGLDGTDLRRLARINGPGRFTQPSFLPDDSAVAVIERRGGLGGPLVTHSRDRGRRVIVPNVGETYDWSPIGDLVAYTRDGILYVVRPDGTEVDALGQSNAIDIEWSPDGKKVAFSVQEILETDVAFVGLYVIEFDENEGKRRRFVVAEGFAAYLDWAPLPPEEG